MINDDRVNKGTHHIYGCSKPVPEKYKQFKIEKRVLSTYRKISSTMISGNFRVLMPAAFTIITVVNALVGGADDVQMVDRTTNKLKIMEMYGNL